MHQETDMELEIQNPNPADVVHCILYVLKATTNLDEKSTAVESMIELLKDKNADGNRWLFLLNMYTFQLYLTSLLSLMKIF